MWRNFSPYSVSLFPVDRYYCSKYIKASRSARRVWKFKLGKNITRCYLPKGFTMLFILTVTAILVNELWYQ